MRVMEDYNDQFEEAAGAWEFDVMQDLIYKAFNAENYELADSFQKQFDDLMSNPSKYDDDTENV